ncbi:MAG: glycosyltransferase, partial [Bacteroidota bacterium]
MSTEKKILVSYFDRQAPKRKRKRRLNRYYWNDITKLIRYFSNEDCSVLEVGCGAGELLAAIPAKQKTGIDFSPAMIEVAKEKCPDAEFFVMDANKIALEKKYDLIILSNLVGYLDDVQQVLLQLKPLCHERTKIVVTYYNYVWEPFLKFAELIGLKRRQPKQNWLSLNDINNLLNISGFDVYRNTRRMLIPVYIPILAEIFNGFFARMPFFRQLCLNFFTFAKPTSTLSSEDSDQRYSVSVIIPARNESGNIENAILRTPQLGKHTEIIFIEGNSTDDTWDAIQKVSQKYASTHDIKTGRQPGKGKYDAVKTGFDIATGDILMILDADLTVPPEDLTKFYTAIASGKGDFVNGSRLVYPMEKEAMRFLNLMGNKFFGMAFTWLLEQKFKDTL